MGGIPLEYPDGYQYALFYIHLAQHLKIIYWLTNIYNIKLIQLPDTADRCHKGGGVLPLPFQFKQNGVDYAKDFCY